MVVRRMKVKEKCKDAARLRRDKERAEFTELSKLLPLPLSATSQLDKASIIRLTSSYLRMRSAFPQGLGDNWGLKQRNGASLSQLSASSREQSGFYKLERRSEQCANHAQLEQQQIKELGSLILQTLDGFVFALQRDGKIMYISETASVHLGLPQIDLTGSSVFDYVHPADHNDIHEILNLSEEDKSKLRACAPQGGTCEIGRSFCMRMKCILPKRNAGLVNSGYKAIHCSGYLKARYVRYSNLSEGVDQATAQTSSNLDSHDATLESDKREDDWESYALVALGHSLLPSASTEVRLTGNSLMFRANLDLKLYYIEAPKLLGFDQFEMVGQSLYQFVHPSDLSGLEQSHRLLLSKGQVVTKYFRLMKKNGGSVWIQSHASLIKDPRNMLKAQHIVSICFVLGENELDESSILHPIFCPQNSETKPPPEGACLRQADKRIPSPRLQSLQSAAPTRNNRKSVLVASVNNNLQKYKSKASTAKKARNVQDLESNCKKQAGCANGKSSSIVKRAKTLHQSNHSNQANLELLSGEPITIEADQEVCNCSYIGGLCKQATFTVLEPKKLESPGSSGGSTRRTSDDSCSIVSSAASASTCSSLSSSVSSIYQHNLNTTPNLSYATAPHTETAPTSTSRLRLLSDYSMPQQHSFIAYGHQDFHRISTVSAPAQQQPREWCTNTGEVFSGAEPHDCNEFFSHPSMNNNSCNLLSSYSSSSASSISSTSSAASTCFQLPISQSPEQQHYWPTSQAIIHNDNNFIVEHGRQQVNEIHPSTVYETSYDSSYQPHNALKIQNHYHQAPMANNYTMSI